jgi:hypothetical protein
MPIGKRERQQWPKEDETLNGFALAARKAVSPAGFGSSR